MSTPQKCLTAVVLASCAIIGALKSYGESTTGWCQVTMTGNVFDNNFGCAGKVVGENCGNKLVFEHIESCSVMYGNQYCNIEDALSHKLISTSWAYTCMLDDDLDIVCELDESTKSTSCAAPNHHWRDNCVWTVCPG